MAKVDKVELAPEGEVVDVEDGQAGREAEDHGLLVRLLQWSLTPRLVRQLHTIWPWLPLPHPEEHGWNGSEWSEVFLLTSTRGIRGLTYLALARRT